MEKKSILLILMWFVEGMIVGFGAILPGISGGTLCVAFGMYRPIIETISNLKEGVNANFPRSVILNRVFGFTKLGFPYKINVFRTFLLKMCGFFAILIE